MLDASFVLAPNELIEDWPVARRGGAGARRPRAAAGAATRIDRAGHRRNARCSRRRRCMAACLTRGIGIEVDDQCRRRAHLQRAGRRRPARGRGIPAGAMIPVALRAAAAIASCRLVPAAVPLHRQRCRRHPNRRVEDRSRPASATIRSGSVAAYARITCDSTRPGRCGADALQLLRSARRWRECNAEEFAVPAACAVAESWCPRCACLRRSAAQPDWSMSAEVGFGLSRCATLNRCAGGSCAQPAPVEQRAGFRPAPSRRQRRAPMRVLA